MNTIYFSPNIFSNIFTFFIAEIVDGETRGTLAMTSLELADKGNYFCKVTYDTGVVVESVTGTLEIYCECVDTSIFTGCFQGSVTQGQRTCDLSGRHAFDCCWDIVVFRLEIITLLLLKTST